MSTARGADLEWLEAVLKKKLAVKTEVLGPASEKGSKQQLMFMNRVLTWETGGIRYEADPRHAEIMMSQLGLGGPGARAVTTPWRQGGVSSE